MTSQCVATTTPNTENNVSRVVPQGAPEACRTITPRADVYETSEALVLVADLPGVKEAGINLTFERNVLTIEADVANEPHPGYEFVHGEYEPGNYRRSFTVHTEIHRDGIVARLQDGVLEITLPKAEPAKVRRISVSAA